MMDESRTAQISRLERELADLRRQRNTIEHSESFSSAARQQAMGRIDTDIATKTAELSQLNAR